MVHVKHYIRSDARGRATQVRSHFRAHPINYPRYKFCTRCGYTHMMKNGKCNEQGAIA